MKYYATNTWELNQEKETLELIPGVANIYQFDPWSGHSFCFSICDVELDEELFFSKLDCIEKLLVEEYLIDRNHARYLSSQILEVLENTVDLTG